MHQQYNFGGLPIYLEPNYNRRRWEVVFNNKSYYWECEEKPTLLDCVTLIANSSSQGND